MTMTTETTGMVDRARQLRPLIAELADKIEQDRRLPERLLEPMHEAGMFRMFLPAEIGGPELDPWTAFEVTEQLSMADASTGWLAMSLSLSAWTAVFLPRDVAAQVFENERSVLAGSVLGEADARIVDGGIVVNGRFHYASGCLHSTWLAAIIADPRHEGPEPAPRLAALVPIEQCTVHDVWQTTGLRGTSSNDWSVEDVFVPWERTFRFLPGPNAGFAKGPLYDSGSLNLPGVAHAGVQLGTARGAVEGFRERIEQRQRRGVPLKVEPAVQSAVGRADALVSAGRAYLKEVCAEVWETACASAELSLSRVARLRSAKTMAMSNAVEAVDLLYEAMGSQALLTANPVERRFRDVHATTAHLMSSRQGFTVAGAVLLGMDPRPTPLLM